MLTTKHFFAVAAAAAIAFASVRPVQGQTSDSESARLEKLERAVDQLQQRNSELEQEVKTLRKQVAAVPEHAPEKGTKTRVAAQSTSEAKETVQTDVAEEKPPIYVTPAGPEFRLTLGGYIQANFEDGDVSAFEGRFGLSALKDRFRLRRARITLTGDFLEQFDFKLEGDLEQSDSAITALKSVDVKTGKTTTVTNSTRTEFSATDVFVNWHAFPEANVRVGQWKAPFGLEQITPDTQLIFAERSLPTVALTPERQIGVEVWGKPLSTVLPDEKNLVTYYAGIFNGNGRNFNTNDNNNFMYVGRLELQPFATKLAGQPVSLRFGGDVLNSRDDAGTNIAPSGNLKVNSDGSLSSFTLPGADERTAWSIDGWFNWGPADIIAEYLSEDVNGRTVNGVAPGFNNFSPSGWYVQGSYFLVPRKLQAAVRWEELDPAQVANDGIHSLTAGLNYYVHGDAIKLMADYVHTWSDFRAANPKYGENQFDEVILRLQLMF